MKPLFSLFLLLLFISCHKTNRVPEFSGTRIIDHPSEIGGQPYLFTSEDESMFSSWLEYINDSLVEFRYNRFENNEWSPAQKIASGDNWFVNWADFPSIAVEGQWMVAHWLQYRGQGTYEYDVHITQSSDGQTWTPSFIPHRDSIAAEHGFATLLPLDERNMLAVWLDGRHTGASTSEEHTNDHHHTGAMTLRSAIFDRDGHLTEETELDERVCDCCQTDAALLSDGPIVVYRDRSSDEIRDIYVVRQIQGQWQEPREVHHDGWKIGGCPVNGPSIVAMGNQVAVAWFTQAGDRARVKLAFSTDMGDSFGQPVIISEGDPAGRVDLVFIGETHVLISWLENIQDGSAMIRGMFVRTDGWTSNPFYIVKTSQSRKSGFPRLAVLNDQIYLSWTELTGDQSRIRTCEILQ